MNIIGNYLHVKIFDFFIDLKSPVATTVEIQLSNSSSLLLFIPLMRIFCPSRINSSKNVVLPIDRSGMGILQKMPWKTPDMKVERIDILNVSPGDKNPVSIIISTQAIPIICALKIPETQGSSLPLERYFQAKMQKIYKIYKEK